MRVVDATELRFQHMVRARERCLQKLRAHYGHIPAPVVAAVSELADAVVRTALTADADLEPVEWTDETAVWRRS